MKKLLITLIIIHLSLFTLHAQSWVPLGSGTDHNVLAMTEYNGNLIAAGEFLNAGSKPANSIALWNGANWSPLGSGLRSLPHALVPVFAVTVYNGNLIAGGEFDSAGTVKAKYVAQWNGTTWSVMGAGFNYWVQALAVYNGNLYAAGGFDSTGTTPINFIAEWNGTSWVPLGKGVNGWIYSLTVYNGALVAGGSFDSAGGIAANNIAQWNGTTWARIDLGTNREVHALAVYLTNLIAGGNFDSAGGYPANNIAEWNGLSWMTLGTGINTEKFSVMPVTSLAAYRSSIIVGGQFDSAGGHPARDIAQWDGTWSGIDSGMNKSPGAFVSALYDYGGILIAGGAFDTAGGRADTCIAEWLDPTAVNNLNNENPGVVVYPNPSNGVYAVSLEKQSGETVVEVYNMLGQQVYATSLNPSQGGTSVTTISLPNGQSAGIYLYRIISEDGSLIGEGKLIKE